MLNIVIPMAGHGSRFQRAGYQMPKPLIPVGEKTMVERVIDNLCPARPHRFIFICQQHHLQCFDLSERLKAATLNPVVIGLNGVTDGAACTVLTAREYIDNGDELMIANCDQFVDTAIDDYLDCMDRSRLDGLIMTMTANNPKWSFVALDTQKLVTRVVEKQVISNEATVGIYNFQRGRDFVAGADAMIARNERVNNEFYVAPVYNDLIASGARVGIYNVGREADGMYGLGIPEDLAIFLSPDVQARLRR